MELFKKVLLLVYTFFVTVVAAVLLITPLSSQFLQNLFDFLNKTIYASFLSKLITFVIVLIFLCLGIYFLFTGIKKNKQSLSIVKTTDLGELSVSLASIESLAYTSIKNTKGIKEIKVDTEKDGEGVDVILKLVVFPEVIVTEMTKKIQTLVKSDIEAATGIKVMKVIVMIENVTSYTMRSTAE